MSGILNLLLAGAASVIKDAYFNLVTLLLNTTATNGAQNNTFLDSSTNNFTITRNGNTTQGTFTPFSQTGWSNYFNGSNSYMTLGGAASLALSTGDFEISMWAYWNSVGTQVLYEGRPGSNGAYPVILTNSSVLYYFVNSSNAITGPTVVANQWYYITVSRVSGTTKMFVNGSQVGSNYTDSTNYATGGTAPWIGAGYAPGDYMNGYISNLRVVVGSGVASQTVPTTPLTAITNTKLLTCQSNRFVDSSASPLTITVNGTPSVQAFSPFAPTAAYSTSVVGGSGYFDGTGDFLTVPAGSAFAPGTGDFTVDGWIYPTSGSAIQRFYAQSTSGTNYFLCEADVPNKTIRFIGTSSGGGTPILSAATLNLNQWNNFCISRTSGTVTVWCNGSAGTATSNTTNFSDTSYTPTISGYSHSTGSEPIIGYLSGLRYIKGTALSGATVPTSPPTAVTNTSLLTNFINAGIYDSAAKNVLETVGNAQVSTAQAKFGTTSMYFDGSSSSWLLIPFSRNLDISTGSPDWTLECWAYIVSYSNSPYLFNKGGVAATYYTNYSFVIPSSGVAYMALGNNGGESGYNFGSVSTNTWYHFAATRQGNTIRTFLNGTLVTNTTIGTAMADNGEGLYVGCLKNLTSNVLNGYVDDLRITKGYARYTANFTPPAAAFPIQ